MSTLHMMGSTSTLRAFCALSAAPSKLSGSPTTRCHRLPSIATGLRRTKLPLCSCSASSNIGLEQISLGKTDTELPSEIQTNGEAQSKKGFLFSSHGWAAFRVDHEDLDMLKQFSHVQAEAFHVPFAIFDDFFFSIFEGEVLSSLLHKIRHASPKRFACLVAVPEQPQSEQNKVVGVVDAAAMADQHILRCLPGVDEYLYISGMAVDSNHRRQKVATVLLQACDLTAMEWGFEYLVLQAYEDDRGARAAPPPPHGLVATSVVIEMASSRAWCMWAIAALLCILAAAPLCTFAISGSATYYTTYVPSSCYGYDTSPFPPGPLIAAANSVIFNNKAACGSNYRITCVGNGCNGGSVVVKVVDLCPSCGPTRFDLSQEAFSSIANLDVGVITIDYEQV